MLIDLPVAIILDCQDARIERAAGTIIGTLRFDPDDYKIEALFFDCYPPRTDVGALGEPADAILAFAPIKTLATIRQRAARSPYDYAVGTEEARAALQEAADAEREPTL